MDPNQQDPNKQNNPYIPPPPGSYDPNSGQQPAAAPQPQAVQPNQPQPLEVDQIISKKKKQAKILLVIAGAIGLLLIVSIIILVVSSSSSSNGEVDRNTEEQLLFDTNRLGLAIINYNNGNRPFEITPETAAELRVSYIQDEFNDPRTGNAYTITTSIPQVGEMQYVIGGICNGDDSISQSGDDSNFAIRVLLEDENQLYCLEKSEVEQFSTPPEL